MLRWLMATLAVLVGGCGWRSTDDWLRQLKDPDVMKRREAVRELGSLTSEASRVTPALSEALRDESPYVRRDAAVALGKLGPEAEAAAPALTAALKDRDRAVRGAADAALKKIAPGARPASHP
jgi:HEAT repeat protein